MKGRTVLSVVVLIIFALTISSLVLMQLFSFDKNSSIVTVKKYLGFSSSENNALD